MQYETLMYIHLATVVPAFFLGTIVLIMRKGTPVHKLLGRIYMGLMLVTGIITLLMPAMVGPRFLGHFGYVHLFSVLTLYTVPSAFFAARKGNIKRHKRGMILLYIGGMLIAGGFTFFPGRYLHQLFFG